jgi:uncharacterized protein (DUF2062 family)
MKPAGCGRRIPLRMCSHVAENRPENPNGLHDPEPLNIFVKNWPVKNWLKRRIIEPLLALLKQGISPHRLALCVAIGVVVGNIPILGVSTILCAAIALAFRLNLPAIQIVQAAMAPTQLLLIIPFVRLGEWILRVPPESVSINQGMALLAQGAGYAIAVLWDAILHAGLAWILVAPLAVYSIYKLLTPVFVRAAAQIK